MLTNGVFFIFTLNQTILKMLSKKEEIPTFHLGITMAGAVSAGAYTAGFMDYLFEVLNLWEIEKERIRNKISKNEELTDSEQKIPLYDVKIEALGGASAGGMVSVMSLLALYKDLKPVKQPVDFKTGNILYDSWVLLDDDIEKEISTLEKMLVVDDLETSQSEVNSLLNSKPIDNVAENVFEGFKTIHNTVPSFISDDLRVLLTLCNLKGVSFEAKFQQIGSKRFNYEPGHRMTEHTLVAHFKTKFNQNEDKDKYLDFNLNDAKTKELIKLCTKATGAFPVGFASRDFKDLISQEYVKYALLKSLRLQNVDTVDVVLNDDVWHNFSSVDGGTINNEPYDEVMQVLKEKYPEDDNENPTKGILLIDPFPNFYDENKKKRKIRSFYNGIFDVVFRLVGTLLNQVRVKRMGFLYEKDFRVLAFPSKWTSGGKEIVDHPRLASSALGGFGGFLSREFRKHDFFLGRKNAQNMLNSYFSLKYDEADLNPLFKDLSQEMLDAFLNKKTNRFPIIPDVNKVLMGKNYPHPYEYVYKEYPKIDEVYLDKLKKPLKKRLQLISKIEINGKIDKSWVFRNVAHLARRIFTGKLTNYLLDELKEELKERQQLKL